MLSALRNMNMQELMIITISLSGDAEKVFDDDVNKAKIDVWRKRISNCTKQRNLDFDHEIDVRW